VSTPRSELAAAIARRIQQLGGAVTSVLPPKPAEPIRYECRTDAQANEIAVWLRERRFRVNDLGSVQRLVHNGVEEIIEVDLGDGVKRERVVTHPGLALVRSFEVVLPSDASMREIPGKPPPRPVKGPPQRRRRG
jgi:hypothetical protein